MLDFKARVNLRNHSFYSWDVNVYKGNYYVKICC